MELTKQRVEFPGESAVEIGGTRYLVAAHFDESSEPLQPKVARLLQCEAKKSAPQV